MSDSIFLCTLIILENLLNTGTDVLKQVYCGSAAKSVYKKKQSTFVHIHRIGPASVLHPATFRGCWFFDERSKEKNHCAAGEESEGVL